MSRRTEEAYVAWIRRFIFFHDKRHPAEIDGIVRAQRPERLPVVLSRDEVRARQVTQVATLTLKSRLPALAGITGFAEAGGLVSYGPNFPEISRRAAAYVDKIIKGAKPGDLPVEQPTNFELVINAKTARSLGLTISPSLLIRTDRIIQ